MSDYVVVCHLCFGFSESPADAISSAATMLVSRLIWQASITLPAILLSNFGPHESRKKLSRILLLTRVQRLLTAKLAVKNAAANPNPVTQRTSRCRPILASFPA